MQELVINQLKFCFISLTWGIFLFWLYDWILLFRRHRRKNDVRTGMEDICFWTIAAIFIYRMSFYENYGRIRLYGLAALFGGMAFYRCMCHEQVYGLMCKVADKIRHVLGIPYKFVKKCCAKFTKKWISPLLFRAKSYIIGTLRKKGDVHEENQKSADDEAFP